MVEIVMLRVHCTGHAALCNFVTCTTTILRKAKIQCLVGLLARLLSIGKKVGELLDQTRPDPNMDLSKTVVTFALISMFVLAHGVLIT